MFPVPLYKRCPSGAGPREGRVPIRNPNGRTWDPGSVQVDFRPGVGGRSGRSEVHELPDSRPRGLTEHASPQFHSGSNPFLLQRHVARTESTPA